MPAKGISDHKCRRCTMLKSAYGAAQNDLVDAKRKLVRHADNDSASRYVEQAAAAKQRLKEARLALDVHDSECEVADSSPKPPAFAGLDWRSTKVDLPPAIDLAAMAKAGMTHGEIGEQYGCSASTISERLRDSGVMVKKPQLRLLIPGMEDADWVDESLCAQVDPEIFFPEKGGSTKEAKKVCLTCEVRNDCLEWALTNQERFGIWGGLSERERRKVTKERAADHPPVPQDVAS